MSKSLVIVESPAKARTINKYLGKDFVVKSSVGHIRDLPTSGSASTKSGMTPSERAKLAAASRKLPPKQREANKRKRAKVALVNRMGIDPENGWKPRYEIVPGKEKVVAELQKLAKDADAIYLATDLDREGEAIAWHLREAIGGKKTDFKRVVFNEITKKAIQAAFANPTVLDQDQVNAQQTRRFLDRVVGYMVSPLLWKKIARGLSAGRVQSVAVKLVVEREREINAFDPEEYWEVHCDLNKQKADPFTVQVMKFKDEGFRPNNQTQADVATASLNSTDYLVDKIVTKPSSSRPRAPFITSTLQQAASTRLGFGVKKTMMMAQRLYEGGFITYMRTDSTNLSAEAVQDCRAFIENKYGKKYLPDAPISYASSEGAQEAHEAVRPSNVNTMLSDVKGLDKDAIRLYELIWRQFVACQMPTAKFDVTTLTILAGEYELRTKGRVVIFDGWTRVQPPQQKKDDEATLPAVDVGDQLNLIKVNPSQHFTKPPPRYTEASLVKELEKQGIGRPSTYANIISTIQDRGYVTVDRRRFHAEKIGEIVTDRLSENFSDLMDYGFTADMEQKLDAIARGKKDWQQTLDSFYADFKNKLASADDDENGMRGNDPVETDIHCPTCDRPMAIRVGSTGVFLGCTGYALPAKERCKSTINLIPGEEAESITEADDEDQAEVKNLMDKHRCPKCAAAMNHFLIDEERKLHICSRSPDCLGFEIELGHFRIKGYEGPIIECDKCGADMELKTGRFGKYFGCSNTECKNTRKLLRSGEAAPPKADPIHMPELPCEKTEGYFILRDGAAGIFLASSAFPKSRETRAPLVSEILPHAAEIDPKYKFLCAAPVQDDRGNPSKIRFSRKNKEQYVMSEVEDKATGWTAHYHEGKWQENIIVKKKAVKKKKTSAKKKTTTKKKVKKKA
ncbi:MAG: type I DNA topoisomerase [Thiohalomonadales bacterium]